MEPVVVTRRQSASGLGMLAVGFALLFPTAFSPALNAPFWSPRFALALAVAAVGLPLVAVLVVHREKAAIAASVLLLVAAASALASSRPLLSATSGYDGGSGLLLLAASVSCWALGRALEPTRRARLESAVLLGAVVNSAVALLQVTFSMRPFRLGASVGAHGLLGNPVHLGALLAGAVAILAVRFDTNAKRYFAVVILIGVALQLSGSRIGTAAALGVAAFSFRRSHTRTSLGFAGVLLAGLAIGIVIEPVLPHARADTVVAKTLNTSAGQLAPRVDAWRVGLAALGERPLLGYGPARFAEAFSPNNTVRVARSAPDTVFSDAHNLFVEQAVTVGPAGVLALCGFLGLAAARARGPLLLVAIGILCVYLLQPLNLATMPVAFLALGAADPSASPRVGRARALSAVLMVPALIGGGLVVLGDYYYREADLDFKVADGRRAAQLLAPWPNPASKQAQIWLFAAMTHSQDPRTQLTGLHRSRQWLREATDRDPAVATYWNNLGDLELFRGRFNAAADAFDAALIRNPFSLRALVGRAVVAEALDTDPTPYLDRAGEIVDAKAVRGLMNQRRQSVGPAAQ